MGDITRIAKETLEAPRVDQGLQRPGLSGRAVRRRERAQPSLAYAPGAHQGFVESGRADGHGAPARPSCCPIAISDAIHGRTSMGDLLAFFVALVSIAQPLRSLVGVSGPLQQGIAAGQRAIRN